MQTYINFCLENKTILQEEKIDRIAPSSSLKDNLLSLYELEYKYSILKTKEWTGLPQRLDSILNFIEKSTYKISNKIIEQVEPIFYNWLESHNIEEPRKWAIGRVLHFEYVGDSMENILLQAKKQFYKYGSTQPNINLRNILRDFKKFSSLEKMAKSIYKDSPKKENMSFNDFWKDWTESFATDIFQILLTKDKYTKLVSLKDFIIEFYEHLIFPDWILRAQRRNIEYIFESIKDSYKLLQTMKSKSIDIGKVYANFSIILNTIHQGGTMMDYVVEKYPDVNTSYLNWLSSGAKIKEWEKELTEIGVSFK